MRSVRLFVTLATLLLIVCSSAVDAKKKEPQDDDASLLKESTFNGLELRGIGPALMSGRIADIAIHPKDAGTWYVAVGSGGVWKSGNAGTTWESIFDDQSSYSIGCIALDPNQPETVWVGSGENVGGRHVGYGDGVYRSRDGGKKWERVGLERSEHISKILIDPRDSKVIFVAAQGPLWSGGGERGLFRSKDDGATWEKILGGGDFTGVNDAVFDPRNPDVLYASTHQRLRSVAALINGGPESGIHKSTDGGNTWRKLENGLPEEDMGKIGLAVSPQRPDVVYAAIELGERKGGVWRSADAGGSWEKRSDRIAGGTGPHYYQEIYASPHEFDRLFFMDVRMGTSTDGGKSWSSVESDAKHVDNHALAFNPADPDYLLAGCDGGLYESWDMGKSWKFVSNLPVTQFYKVAVDYDEPFYNVYGGTQDNNSQGGPSRTDTVNGIVNSDWFVTLFGDGHQPAADPTEPDIVYSEWQEGNLVRFDRKTGEMVYIQPQPEIDEPEERFNWDAPILISSHDPRNLLYASQRVWSSPDRGDSWRAISGDLTRGLDRLTLPMMDRIWAFEAVWDLYAMSKYGTITSLAQSPLDAKLIYAGTDDGLIQVTEDGGKSWRRIDALPGVPEFFFVNDIKADLYDANTVYVVVDHHKRGDYTPYVLKSVDRGRVWSSIAGDLPERHLAWRLVQDHEKRDLLFLGTEFGIFFTVDGGGQWIKLGGGVPNIPFRDLAIQKRENDLVGASFGRSFWILDDYSALRSVSERTLETEAQLFPVRKAWWYVPRRPLGDDKKASQGDAFFVAPNPPFGAVFTYYLKDEIRTGKKQRLEREKELAEQGADTPYPGWEALRAESLEEQPTIVLTVRDGAGDVVRRLAAPATAGFHRVAWDLRFPSTAPWRAVTPDDWNPFGDGGPLAPPGRYSVSLEKRVDGQVSQFGARQEFDVVKLRDGTLPAATPAEVSAFQQELFRTRGAVDGARAAIDHSLERLAAIKSALDRSRTADDRLAIEARTLERRLREMRLAIAGDSRREEYGDPGEVSISRRMGVAHMGTGFSTYGPTATHRRSLEIAVEKFAAVGGKLDALIRIELPALERELDREGVPWTPGRATPGAS